jgi:hypothetical protein
MERVHIITYGNDRFANSKVRLRRELEDFGFLPQNIHVYEPKDIDEEYVAQSQLDWSARGNGYWRWKPYILDKTIREKMADGDIGFYIDAGCTIRNNPSEQERFRSYLEILKTKEILCWTDNVPECGWTKQDIFDYFDIKHDEREYRLGQYGANQFMWRVSPNTRAFFAQYVEVARLRPDLFSDELRATQWRGFAENRHDQSIFSCMVHLFHNYEVILYNLYYGVVYVARIRN